MKLLPAVAGLVLVGCALPAMADSPTPDMLAQATLQAAGVTVAWSAPPAAVEDFVVQRSHAGSPFTAIATLDGTTFSYQDLMGDATDVYMVVGTIERVITSKSNPAPVMVDTNCPWFTTDTPPEVNCACFPCP
jgi:hypothetical protein